MFSCDDIFPSSDYYHRHLIACFENVTVTSMTLSEKDFKWLVKAECGARIFSTCGKRQYMAILVDSNGFELSNGYNGTPPGFDHCIDGGCPRLAAGSASGTSYNNCYSAHAETNCISRADPVRTVGATLYVNGSPCFDCTKVIACSRVHRVVCLDDTAYAGWSDSKDFLLKSNVVVDDICIEKFLSSCSIPDRGLFLDAPRSSQTHISCS